MCSKQEKEILERIIKQKGDCTGMELLCEKCPMNKLKKREDGSYFSCWESIITVTLHSEKDCEAYYQAAAENKLSEIMVEEVFLNED